MLLVYPFKRIWGMLIFLFENNFIWISEKILCFPAVDHLSTSDYFISGLLFVCIQWTKLTNHLIQIFLLVLLQQHEPGIETLYKYLLMSVCRSVLSVYSFKGISGMLMFYFENDFIWISGNIVSLKCFLYKLKNCLYLAIHRYQF